MRIQVTGVAALTLALDELLKVFARVHLTQCDGPVWTSCERVEVIGSLWIVRTTNAGSAFGFGQGLWVWVLLALAGVILIPLYSRRLRRGGRAAAVGMGLQLGGAVGNVMDRLLLGGATDVIYLGRGPVWNLADVALLGGALLATWALCTRR